MRTLIYQTLKSAILAITDENQNPVFQHVDIWNHQLDLAEEEQPFYTPAVFIEFGDINWQTLPHGRREAVCLIILHVVTSSRVGRWDDAVARFELLDDFYAALFGFTYSDPDGNAIDSMTLVTSHTDHYFDELQDNTETYSCHITGAPILRHRASVSTNAGIDLSVSSQATPQTPTPTADPDPEPDPDPEQPPEAPPDDIDSPIIGN